LPKKQRYQAFIGNIPENSREVENLSIEMKKYDAQPLKIIKKIKKEG